MDREDHGALSPGGAVHARRRARVLEHLEGAALILPAAPEIHAGRDLELRYRPDADLLYLTGYTEPEAVAVLCPSDDKAPFTLFVRPRDPDVERWTGMRGGVEAARERFGADAAYPIGELEERLGRILGRVDSVYLRLDTRRQDVFDTVRRVVAARAKARQRTGQGPRALVDAGVLLDEMRLIKDAHEIERLREAARITAESFAEAASAIRPGAGEWELEAAVEAAFRRRGAEGTSFATIAAAGANATVLHYVENAARMRDGDLVLLDAGAQWRHYAGDVSRTFPVSGRFTPAQRTLYGAVLAARDAAIRVARPGATLDDIHRAAVSVMLDTLVAEGLLEGTVEELLARGDDGHRAFVPHKTSHWLGLDVHDVGDYAVGGAPRALVPGMVFTIEPGLYIPEIETSAPPEMRGIGIRIEDDVLVTADGCEVLTAMLPAEAEAVEAMVRG